MLRDLQVAKQIDDMECSCYTMHCKSTENSFN